MYARIVNDVAIDVYPNPSEVFHSAIVQQFESVPGNVKKGWARSSDGAWSEPDKVPDTPEPEPEKAPPRLSRVEFMQLFTTAERVFLRELRQTDPVLDDFFKLIEDDSLELVNMALSSTISGVNYCLERLSSGDSKTWIIDPLDVDSRREEILSGTYK